MTLATFFRYALHMTIKQDLTPINFTSGGMKQIRGIVLHSMWGTQAGSISWFKNPSALASAHYCISKDGEIIQMVRDTDMAWHAGIYDEGKCPTWAMPNPNFYCLGIELEDNRDNNWGYPEPQREALRWLVKLLMEKYSISQDHILLHKNLNPSRRSDPVGAFSFDWLFQDGDLMQEELDKCRIDRDSHWNDLTAIKEALGLESDNSTERVINSIGGIKGEATQARKKLAEAEQEIENRKQQVSRLEADVLMYKNERDEARSNNELLHKQIDDLSKTIGGLNNDLARCRAGQEKCTIISLIRKLFTK